MNSIFGLFNWWASLFSFHFFFLLQVRGFVWGFFFFFFFFFKIFICLLYTCNVNLYCRHKKSGKYYTHLHTKKNSKYYTDFTNALQYFQNYLVVNSLWVKIQYNISRRWNLCVPAFNQRCFTNNALTSFLIFLHVLRSPTDQLLAIPSLPTISDLVPIMPHGPCNTDCLCYHIFISSIPNQHIP